MQRLPDAPSDEGATGEGAAARRSGIPAQRVAAAPFPAAGQARVVACAVCGGPIDPLWVGLGPTCRSVQCLGKVGLKRKLEKEERLRQLERKAVRDWVSAQGYVVEGDNCDVVTVVPAFLRELTPLDPGRIAAFRGFLASAIEEAAAWVSEQSRSEEEPAPDDDDPGHPVLGTACSTCGGSCCRGGGDHAYLRADQIVAKLSLWGARAVVDIVGEYVAHVPAFTYANSCIFHGERGCSLPRRLRSGICNRFRCDDLKRLADALDSTAAARVHIGAVEEGVLHRTMSVTLDPTTRFGPSEQEVAAMGHRPPGLAGPTREPGDAPGGVQPRDASSLAAPGPVH